MTDIPRGTPLARLPPPFTFLIPIGSAMSPYLFDADLGATDLGRKARAATLVIQAPLSISDLFAEYAAAGRARRAEIRLAADPELLAELDGFDYPAAA